MSEASGSGRLRTVVGIVGVASAICAGIGMAAHFFGPVSTAVTLVASFSPLFVVLAAISVTVLVATRYWYVAAAALIITVVGVAAQLPLYLGERASAPAETPRLRLLQANIRLGEADPRALVDRVRSDDVDVLTAAELTQSAVDRLAAAGIDEALPFTYLRPREGGGGEGIYSRYPLTDAELLPGLKHNNVRATVDMPGAEPFAVYALHPLPPYPEASWRWALELDRIGAILAAESRPLIIGADFNSTYDHERYRNLLTAGGRDGSVLIDAADFLGSGIVATYPADRWYPAVLAIDRILTRGGTPVAFRRVALPGSDHHGVLGDVLLAAADQR
ncbi:endonuclease/exonuclease/phosphatase family protein [Mycolicibacterium sp. CR10]|uniref:endonuclease/exonuclease/phosphatase family protein n=1 Tax=Mycolicibacterium sp. CR10 TaxID=2562314 RepID=UPI001F1091C9|nr:endonuclease/exonuclease/phosphatase family protein [Mycolicibacterium sp. CR10]